ncbi:MAG: hypothetical protein M8364_04540 [Methylobacter sp.]|uniref:hypothetical protein n=1 Tax=Methylobacter sp. TaxID=2051955 RepID=UPI00258F351F|nr:hypothetical protein [Methylobacter sp.]MCL7420155.1 hypothetical protein [Methylobacter sp.]
MSGVKLIQYLIVTCMALFFARLIFEVTPYASLYQAAGLGATRELFISNLLYFVLGWVFLGVLAISLVTALVLAVRGPRPNRIAAVWLVGVVTAILMIQYMAYAFRFPE